MLVSAFRNAWDRDPREVSLTPAQLLARMCSFSVRDDIQRRIETNQELLRSGRATGRLAERWAGRDIEDACEAEARWQKASLPAWCPATFEGTRKKSHTKYVTAYVIDVDGGAGLDAAARLLPGKMCGLHTSWSHTELNPKFRVVFPLARPIPARHWKKCWARLCLDVRASGIEPDRKCVNPDRLYFLPAVKSASSPRASMVREGELLYVDWESIPEPRHRETKIVIRRPGAGVLDYRDPVERMALARRIGADIDDERAFRITCPRCGRRDVYYFLQPESRTWAKCNHERGCGWYGPLSELEGR